MPDDLTLRRTVIGGETAPDDFVVLWDHKTIDVGGRHAWSWTCFLPNVPQRSAHRGRAASLDAAKAAFRAAWTDLQSEISHG